MSTCHCGELLWSKYVANLGTSSSGNASAEYDESALFTYQAVIVKCCIGNSSVVNTASSSQKSWVRFPVTASFSFSSSLCHRQQACLYLQLSQNVVKVLGMAEDGHDYKHVNLSMCTQTHWQAPSNQCTSYKPHLSVVTSTWKSLKLVAWKVSRHKTCPWICKGIDFIIWGSIYLLSASILNRRMLIPLMKYTTTFISQTESDGTFWSKIAPQLFSNFTAAMSVA